MINWEKASFSRFVTTHDTSTCVAEVVVTVEGESIDAYLKPMGNRAGNHVLACEWIGSRLASWFGLPTLDFGIMQIDEEDEIPLCNTGYAVPGPAFVSRREPGEPWSGNEKKLKNLLNPEDVMRLVLLDTWTLNADRFPPVGMTRNPHPDNVFLSDRDGIPGRQRLIAMDHTHCFTNGNEVTARLSSITNRNDRRIYGLFPGFKPFMNHQLANKFIGKFRHFSSTMIEKMLAKVPREWGIGSGGLSALYNLITDRARFLAEETHDIFHDLYATHDGKLFKDGGINNGGK
jgi:hypothetical protein